MKFRAPLCLLMLVLPLILVAAEDASTPAPAVTPTPKKKHEAAATATPRIFPLRRWLRALGIDKSPTAGFATTGFKGLEISLKVDPPQATIGETKQLKATVTLLNRGKKITQLDFPTSQRIEVLVKNSDGKMIEQWSEDQAFDNEPSLVSVNPNERLEYAVSLSTRDMVAGQTYTVDAYFPNFEQLRKSMTVPAVTPAPKATPAPGGKSSPTPAAGSKASAPSSGGPKFREGKSGQ
jgi:hypothetical protein